MIPLDIDLLSLDAGNTVLFLDHARIARFLASHGFSVAVETLIRVEGEAKALQESNALLDLAWADRALPGARGWGAMLATMIARAGVDEDRVLGLLPLLWKEHVDHNLYSKVPDELGPSLLAVRRLGVHVVIVSNSEGMLETLFEKLGILSLFDAVFDSAKVGVEKPDPRIFEAALQPYGVLPSRALHLGDTYATDIVGAHAAGMHAALIDPFGHYEGRLPNVPRVEGVVAVAQAMVAGDSPNATTDLPSP